ncbi:MAG: ATP-binding protein [Planctomycetota bacterium]
MSRVKQVWLWGGTLWGLCVSAQAAEYPLVAFEQLQGVTVHGVIQDSSGSIWLASDHGLWRWTNGRFGAETHRFPTVNPTECFLEEDGVLWVGTGDGLVGIQIASGTPRQGPPELQGVPVHEMLRDPQGQIWGATSLGLYRLSLGATPAAELVPGTRDHDLHSVAVDPRGRLWTGAGGKLLCYDGHTLSEHFTEALAGREVHALAVSGEGALWIGLRGGGGLYQLDGEDLVQLLPRRGEEAPEVNVIVPHRNGEVWIGTERGVLRWTGREFVRIDRDTGLAHDAVLGLYLDREELVWLATRGGGVYQLRSPYVLTYNIYDGLPHPVVQAILPRPNGDFIVGTVAGLCRMDAAGRVVQAFRYLGNIQTLYADDVGRLWAGGRDGLVCFDEGSGDPLDFPHVRTLRNITAIGPHEPGGVRICTTSGLWQVDGDGMRLVPLPTESGETDARLNSLYVDANGRAYLATPTGVLLQDATGLWSRAPSGREVHCVTADSAGRLWFGTSQGLMTLEEGFCRDVYRRGSPHGKVGDLSVDPGDTLWLATPEGLSRFDGTRFTMFGNGDGLPSDDVRCVRALATGVLLVGTSQGLAVVESGRISPSRAAPRVAVTGFKAGGEQYGVSDAPFRVPNWQRNVSVSFQGTGFRQDLKGLRYRSRLIGFEEDWSAPWPEPARSYTNLPWGDYTFQVKAVNAEGMESDQIASVAFSVGPPVWLDPWFLGGCTIALSALSAWVLATQRKKRELQRAAEAATRAKSAFLAKVSHEIRTPLTVIMGCTERLADTRESPSGLTEALAAIRRNSNHLLGLINDLLDLSKIEADHLQVRLEAASVHEILMGVDAIMHDSAEQQGLDFRILYETAVPDRIVTDPGRLSQALINLVGNAIKFTPEGHIYIRVRVDEGADGRWLEFAVEDTGVGVPPDKVDLIFEAFSQAESSVSRKLTGTGLGLAIARSIAEHLNGRLTVQSEVGRGSTFTLAIDLSKVGVESLGMETRMVSAADLAAERTREAGSGAQGDREPALPTLAGHILLAEDAQDVSTIMRLQLESAGAQVMVVDNGLDAVEKAYDGRFDVIIMDIHMPGLNGINAIRELRTRGVETPIIVISADSSPERCRECAGAGANGFVPKPYQKEPFLREVWRHLKGRTFTRSDDFGGPIRSELDLRSPKMAAAVSDFVRALEQRVTQMENALACDDQETLTRLAHQLKGGGGIHGYMCVSEKARRFEEALAHQDEMAIRAGLGELRGMTERIVAGLRLDGITLQAAGSD